MEPSVDRKRETTAAGERDEIVLIGPVGAGKSTIGKLLAARLSLPQVSMDDIRYDYYREIGYDDDYARRLQEEKGIAAKLAYWKRFEAHAVERLLADHHDCVFDLGAGHSVYEDEALFGRVTRALRPFRNVVLLLPHVDVETSLDLIAHFDPDLASLREANRHFLEHPSNRLLAKHVVYTAGKTPDETCAEVLRLTTSDPSA